MYGTSLLSVVILFGRGRFGDMGLLRVLERMTSYTARYAEASHYKNHTSANTQHKAGWFSKQDVKKEELSAVWLSVTVSTELQS